MSSFGWQATCVHVHAVAAGEFQRRLAHRAAAEERPQHHRVGAAGRQPFAGARERHRLRLAGIAAHAHVLAVRQRPAVQRVLLHRRHHRLALRVDGDADMAALPFQQPRAVGLRRDEPQARTVVMRGADPLALAVEGQAGHRRRMRQAPSASSQPHRTHAPSCPTAQASTRPCRRAWLATCSTHFIPNAAMSVDGAVEFDAAQLAVVAARTPTAARMRRQRKDRAVMHRQLRASPRAAADRPAAACHRPARTRRVRPPRSKRAATTKAPRSRLVPRASIRNCAVSAHEQPMPSPMPASALLRLARLEAAPKLRAIEVAADEHDPAACAARHPSTDR